MQDLDVAQFCYLSTAPAWLSWLHEFSLPLYTSFVEHMRKKPSCRANQDKMMQVLADIERTPTGQAALRAFLIKSFPHIVTAKPTQQLHKQVVFPHYDPSLATIPRRHIITVPDLAGAIREFSADKIVVKYVIVDGSAYIEYLPRELAHYGPLIPAANWLVDEFKKSQQ